MRHGFTSLVMLLGASLCANAAVIVVDLGGGGDYGSINEGVAAAGNGDIVVVKSGDYRGTDLFGVFVDGKSIVLVGDGPTQPMIPGISVKNISPGGSCIVHGFTMLPHDFYRTLGGVVVQLNQGGVLFEDCTITGAEGGVGFAGGVFDAPPAIDVQLSSYVALTRCFVTGGRGVFASSGPINQNGSTRGGIALAVDHSLATAFDSTLTGGAGGNGNPALFNSNRGGYGCKVSFGTLRMHGANVAGGAGGNSLTTNVASCGTGGDGLVVGTVGAAESFASTFVGGPGGVTTNGIPAAPGNNETVTGTSTHTLVSLTAKRTFSVSAPAHELAPVSVAMGGLPNDLVFVFQAFKVAHTAIGNTVGWLALGPQFVGPFTFGSVGPTGNAQFSVNAPLLASPLLEGQAFLFEPVFANAQEFVVGPPTCFVLLHP